METTKVAVVTGAARGLGQAISTRLAKAGFCVVAVDQVDSLETVAAIVRFGGVAVSRSTDVASPRSVDELEAFLTSEYGRVDVLVNNAGVFPKRPFESMDLEFWRKVLAVNLDSQFLMTQAVLPLMKASGSGRIINISSNSVGLPVPDFVPYVTSKMGVIGFTRALSVDLAKYGITVNAVAPGLTKTPGAMANYDEVALEKMTERQPVKRAGTSEDAASAVLFLASDDSEFITGQTVVVDGGLVRL
ncbi:SDR family NAD(P)-dependent oxidoreductase [Nocardioides endophyticus]|uniref:SDR family NAD(P)-dependent oxidoreductase n=1 Tax=Nocardioides endophyticus TaxID=1353775 RepID=A0ABP8YI77_9ACTN